MIMVACIIAIVLGCGALAWMCAYAGDEHWEDAGDMVYGTDHTPLARPVRSREDDIDQLADELGWLDVDAYERARRAGQWMQSEHSTRTGRN